MKLNLKEYIYTWKPYALYVITMWHFLFVTSGKLHRALRLSVEHIPDVGLQDIEEEDEAEIEEEIEEEHDSGNEFDEQDGSKETGFSQDGITSDEIDIMPRSKSCDC